MTTATAQTNSRRPSGQTRLASGQDSEEALTQAVKKLSALAHRGRLVLLRLLIQAGPEGLAAGELARLAQVGATTASAQLLVLSNTGLVVSRREGRKIIYVAQYPAMEGLLGFLLQDCCGGRAEICAPLADQLQPEAQG